MQNLKCEIDGKEFFNGGVMARHIKKKYGLTYKEYHHKYILKTDAIPKCKCGCGGDLPWTNTGYKELLKGHYSRIHNNWGNNIKAQLASAETRRKQYAAGERQSWNVGLTKETDDRVKENGISSAKSYTDERKQEYSNRMRKMRNDGTIPTLYGKDSSQWQGGVSSVNQIARASTKLYKEWKYPILVRDGFKCTHCPNTTDLHVHHDKETFSEIIKKVMTIDDYEKLEEFDRKKEVSERVVDYHINQKVSGITLCSGCHNDLHPSLNFL